MKNALPVLPEIDARKSKVVIKDAHTQRVHMSVFFAQLKAPVQVLTSPGRKTQLYVRTAVTIIISYPE